MLVDNTALMEKIESKNIQLWELMKNDIIFSPFKEDFKIRFCWSSNSLEGNTLDFEETLDFILYDDVRSGHTFSEYRESKNLYRAISENLIWNKNEITEKWIKQCNKLILGGIQGSGEYRKNNVYIGTAVESVFYPTDYENVPLAMEKLLSIVNIKEDNLSDFINKVSEFHILFERIHPFRDGNGRTGRMILNQQLINQGLLPVSISGNSKYRQAFKAYDRNEDVSLLSHIICNGILESIDRVNDLIRKSKEGNQMNKPEN